MLPILFRVQFGPIHVLGHEVSSISIYSFGLMLAVAFLLGGHLYAKELARRGLGEELAGTVVTAAIVGGIAGGRIYYLVENLDQARTDWLGSIFSGAGLVAYGGLAGGIAAAWLAIYRAGAPVLVASDACAPFLALGWAIGRIGCFLAGDGDYGPPTDLPWGIAFPNGIVPSAVPVHPTPLYEAAMLFVVFAVLYRLRLRPRPAGQLLSLYLVLQGLERCIAELWRTSPRGLAGLSVAQGIGLATAGLGALWFAWLELRSRSAGGEQLGARERT